MQCPARVPVCVIAILAATAASRTGAIWLAYRAIDGGFRSSRRSRRRGRSV
jgi:hypothetical protein